MRHIYRTLHFITKHFTSLVSALFIHGGFRSIANRLYYAMRNALSCVAHIILHGQLFGDTRGSFRQSLFPFYYFHFQRHLFSPAKRFFTLPLKLVRHSFRWMQRGGVPHFSQSNFHQRLIFVYTLRLACNPPGRVSQERQVAGSTCKLFQYFSSQATTLRLDNVYSPFSPLTYLSFIVSVEITFIHLRFFYRFTENDLFAKEK